MRFFRIKSLIAALLILPLTLYANPLAQNISELIAANLPRADVGVMVINAKTGKTIYQHNGFQPFTPASNTKLFTAAAALLYLKPSYFYKTVIYIDPKKMRHHTLYGNLYIKFQGDPSLTVKHLETLIAKVKAYGIRKIAGDIVIDNKRFQAPYYPKGTSIDDINWCYSAPITTVILNENAVGVTVVPSKVLGHHARILPDHYSRSLLLKSQVKTVTASVAKNHCQLLLDVSTSNKIQLGGCWPMSTHASWLKIALKNPLLFAKSIIKKSLAHESIHLTGTITTGHLPKNKRVIARHYSASLRHLVIRMLKNSDNLYADAINKTLGSVMMGHGTFQEGCNAVQSILAHHTNINFNQLSLVDGAGTRYNLISPQQMTQLLYMAYHDAALRSVFFMALPDAGRDGTLTHRLRAFDLSNNIRAKTGTMHDISALSGVLTTNSGQRYIFSIMINHVVGKIHQAKQLENQITGALVRT